MDLSLLPKEIQILISEFNIEHRLKMKIVMNELCKKTKNKYKYINNICRKCGDKIYNNRQEICKYKKKYIFCCIHCRFHNEDTIRRSFRRRK
jgi:hypothetical protein